MHERNTYKIKRNFGLLGKKYDFLTPFVQLVDGKDEYSIDFQNSKALRALAKALLLDDFGLDVEFPVEVLVPRIPSRLDYILWIEDLIHCYDYTQDQVKGIDIGTGSSAIYALLGARKNNWNMLATEVEEDALNWAVKNIERNNLTDTIKVVKATSETVFGGFDDILKDSKYTFTMCNPPYFAVDEVIGKRRSSQCPGPSGAQTGTKSELSTQGGEVQFITKMIEESQLYSKNILIFTSMVGVLRHLKYIKDQFWKLGICNFLTETIVCGKTHRWFIAWSFDKDILLVSKEPDVSNRIENVPRCVDLESMILGFINEVTISGKLVNCVDGRVIHLVAYENFWSNQRKRRREKMGKSKSSEEEPPAKNGRNSSISKEEPIAQKSSGTSELPREEVQASEKLKKPLIDMIIKILQPVETNEAFIQLTFRGGELRKDGLHQINQFIKNRYSGKAKSLNDSLGLIDPLSIEMHSESTSKSRQCDY